MFRSLLSVLLVGMVATPTGPTLAWRQLQVISVAPPALSVALEPHLSASGVLIADLKSGQVLYAKNADTPRPMASLTKLMTAVIIAENHALTERVTVPAGMENIPGNKAGLQMGDTFTVGDLLSALLIASANDAAETLARFHSGSRAEFVEVMNERAAVLGLSGTSFANPMGLDDPSQWATPEDIAGLAVFAARFPAIRERMARTGETIRSREGRSIVLTHTHALLHALTPVFAGKTGTTGSAGECLVSFVEGAAGHEYVVVLLKSAGRYKDMNTLLGSIAPVTAQGG